MVAGAKRRGKHKPTQRKMSTADCNRRFDRLLMFFLSEMKEAQRKKRQMKERHRQEDSISNAMVIWNNEILPQWDSVYVSTAVCTQHVCASVCFPPEQCFHFSRCVCVQEGNEAGEGPLVARTSSQRQRTSVEPRHRQRAQHHARYQRIRARTNPSRSLSEDVMFSETEIYIGQRRQGGRK